MFLLLLVGKGEGWGEKNELEIHYELHIRRSGDEIHFKGVFEGAR